MGRSLKKGPFVDGYLLKKVEDLNEYGEKSCYQNLVTSFDNFPAIHRSHFCSL